jgi:hypothetical protein
MKTQSKKYKQKKVLNMKGEFVQIRVPAQKNKVSPLQRIAKILKEANVKVKPYVE